MRSTTSNIHVSLTIFAMSVLITRGEHLRADLHAASGVGEEVDRRRFGEHSERCRLCRRSECIFRFDYPTELGILGDLLRFLQISRKFDSFLKVSFACKNVTLAFVDFVGFVTAKRIDLNAN